MAPYLFQRLNLHENKKLHTSSAQALVLANYHRKSSSLIYTKPQNARYCELAHASKKIVFALQINLLTCSRVQTKSSSDMNAVSQIQPESTGNIAERRLRMPAIPEDFFSLITHEQRIALNQKQQFGWFVKFVRRPLFQPIEVVLSNPDGSEFLLLDTEGLTRPFFNVRTDDLR